MACEHFLIPDSLFLSLCKGPCTMRDSAAAPACVHGAGSPMAALSEASPLVTGLKCALCSDALVVLNCVHTRVEALHGHATHAHLNVRFCAADDAHSN